MTLKYGKGPILAICLVVAACAAPPAATRTATYPTDKPDRTVHRKQPVQPAIRPEVIKLPHEYPVRNNSSLVPQELPSPEQLINLTRARLVNILGVPNFKRQDISAEIWQYRNDICILDVFLYREKNDKKFHVKHVEARNRSVARVSLKNCYLNLLQEYSDKNG